MEKIFFDSGESLLRIFITCLFAYAGLVLMLRFVGSRSLSQLNAFDFIITVAIGSTLSSVILDKDIALLDGLMAFAMLLALQALINVFSRKIDGFRSIINMPPALMFYNGKFLDDQMKKHRITQEEIYQVLRSEGIGDIDDVDAIVLENNGKFSVIRKVDRGHESSIQNVIGLR